MKSSPLELCSALGVSEPQIVSAFGGGGKTAILNRLAAELSAAGARVILTTTTKMYRPRGSSPVLEIDPARAVALLQRRLKHEHIAVLARETLPGDKLKGVDPEWMEYLFRETGSFILVEADGAAQKPVKGYALNEPVLPRASRLIVAVTGIDALGSRLTPAEVHRPELLAGSADLQSGNLLTAPALARHLRFMLRLGRRQAPPARAALVFNKIDTFDSAAALVRELTGHLSGLKADRLLYTAAHKAAPVYFSYKNSGAVFSLPVAAVILAAGSSGRMGRDKLQLQYRGRTILEHTLHQVLKAGLDQTVVVTRPGSHWQKVLNGTGGCKVIENPDHAAGAAASLKAGLAAVDGAMQAALFVLGDQPMIPAEAYRALVESHRDNLPLVSVPEFEGMRGNPLLFDRRAWPMLLKLEGDAGGRQLLPRLPESAINRVNLPFPEILLDVDSPEDYQKLSNS